MSTFARKKEVASLEYNGEWERASEVATELGMSANWMSKTVHRYNEGGVEGVKNKSKNEGSKTLSPEQVEELDRLIESGKTADQRLWSSSQIKRWVKEQSGTEIHRVTAWRIFGKLNYSQQVPRPAHQARASAEEREEFKKN